MNSETTVVKPEVLAGVHQHDPIMFDPNMLKVVNKVFQQGKASEYLSGISDLFIADTVKNYFGLTLSVEIKGIPPGIRCIELLTSVNDCDIRNTYGKLAVFTPAQFWNNVTRVIDYERVLADQSDSVLGEDTYGLVFLVEKFVKDVPTLFAVNLYRDSWKGKREYYLTVLKTGDSWEAGHSFAIKVPE
jgi:hypothetical protein